MTTANVSQVGVSIWTLDNPKAIVSQLGESIWTTGSVTRSANVSQLGAEVWTTNPTQNRRRAFIIQ